MSARSLKRFFAIAVALTATLVGCDWIPYTFLNSIPFHGDPKKNPDVYIYLGVDGLSYNLVRTAMQNGAFAGPEWRLSKFITMFPGTSDASWTRIMHTKKLGGYEIEYYDPNKDGIVNPGIEGLAKHIMPSIADFLDFQFDYLKTFDYHANGYTSEYNAYTDTFASLGDTLDNLFYLLNKRVETASVFSGYIIEYDVMSHIKSSDDVMRSFFILSDRIQKFKKRHPERRLHFTLFSDHGNDFIHVQPERLITFSDEMEKVGIKKVSHLAGHDPRTELFAIPVMHTRVTYLAVHTLPELASEVSKRVSTIEAVDLSVNRARGMPDPDPEHSKDPHAPNPLEWFEIWAEGRRAAYFGFDPLTDKYYLPSGYPYARLDFYPKFEDGEDFKVMTDDELFATLKNGNYPDAFYRIRTSLSTTSTEFPGDVMVSLRPTYVSMGFKLPGNDVTNAGFHGALQELGTLGTLLTNERDIPDAVRSDTLLELFPRIKSHAQSLGVEIIEGDPNASLSYK